MSFFSFDLFSKAQLKSSFLWKACLPYCSSWVSECYLNAWYLLLLHSFDFHFIISQCMIFLVLLYYVLKLGTLKTGKLWKSRSEGKSRIQSLILLGKWPWISCLISEKYSFWICKRKVIVFDSELSWGDSRRWEYFLRCGTLQMVPGKRFLKNLYFSIWI